MKITKEQLYKRQTTLTEIGEAGQQKLLKAKVVVIGCGGLGSAAAVYLAASGIGNINLVDYDVVDVSNLHRQVFFKTEDVGKSKVEVLANYIKSISPFVKVTHTNKVVSKDNVFKLISQADFILDCTDSLPIKYLLNDACVIQDKPLIYGSLYKFDGYVSSFNIKQSNESFSANLRDAFPEISKESIPNCSEIGTLNTIVGIIALVQANEVVKLVTGIGKPLIDKILIYNCLDNSQYNMQLKNIFSKEKIQQIFDSEIYFDVNCEVQDEKLLISAKALKQKLSYGEASRKLHIISVNEDTNIKDPFYVHQKIPLSQLNPKQQKFITDNEYVLVCNKGISSYIATQKIKAVHPNLNVLSLKNGITNY